MARRQAPQGFGADQTFRWRGGEISRLEGLSDAVFAFAIVGVGGRVMGGRIRQATTTSPQP